MKNVIIILGAICIVANLLVGFIATAYPLFNVCLNTIVLILNTALLYMLAASSVKDGYKVSMFFLFPFFSIIEFVFGLFASSGFENNWFLILTVSLLFVEGILFTIVHEISKINK